MMKKIKKKSPCVTNLSHKQHSLPFLRIAMRKCMVAGTHSTSTAKLRLFRHQIKSRQKCSTICWTSPWLLMEKKPKTKLLNKID